MMPYQLPVIDTDAVQACLTPYIEGIGKLSIENNHGLIDWLMKASRYDLINEKQIAEALDTLIPSVSLQNLTIMASNALSDRLEAILLKDTDPKLALQHTGHHGFHIEPVIGTDYEPAICVSSHSCFNYDYCFLLEIDKQLAGFVCAALKVINHLFTPHLDSMDLTSFSEYTLEEVFNERETLISRGLLVDNKLDEQTILELIEIDDFPLDFMPPDIERIQYYLDLCDESEASSIDFYMLHEIRQNKLEEDIQNLLEDIKVHQGEYEGHELQWYEMVLRTCNTALAYFEEYSDSQELCQIQDYYDEGNHIELATLIFFREDLDYEGANELHSHLMCSDESPASSLPLNEHLLSTLDRYALGHNLLLQGQIANNAHPDYPSVEDDE